MIRNSFIFLDKINKKTEQNLYKQGILSWDDFLKKDKIKGISKLRKSFYDKKIKEASSQLKEDNYIYLSKIFKNKNSWRLYDHFKEEACFLDIETISVSSTKSQLVLVGLYNGNETKTMIKDINLDFKQLKIELDKFKMIITFNGNVFDIPYLNKCYKDIIKDKILLDLKVVCDQLKLKGGLKNIEKTLGIKRTNKIVEDIKGGDPLTLFKMAKGSNNPYYLNLLIEYNKEDVVNLETIANKTIQKLKEKTLNKNNF